jgi:hypothetical protein
VRSAALLLLALLALLVGVEVALHAAHGVPPGTWGVFGALGCALIVVLSKRLGKAWLQRPEPPDE